MEKIKRVSRNVLELVEKGMTKDEVRSLIGAPRGKQSASCYNADECWNYGKYWVGFDLADIVKCISTEGTCSNGVVK